MRWELLGLLGSLNVVDGVGTGVNEVVVEAHAQLDALAPQKDLRGRKPSILPLRQAVEL